MVTDEPALATWAEVDPGRYLFDPAQVLAVARLVVPEPPPPRPVWLDGRSIGGPEAYAWIDAVSAALAERYGPWAYRWDGSPGDTERLGWITQRLPAPGEAAVFVAGSLLSWRRWLADLAERFDRFLPLLHPEQVPLPGDAVTAWEAAITQLVTTAVARTIDDDRWQGWCRRVLQWFLTAAEVPVERAKMLVDDAIDERFDHWVPPTAAVIAEIAERLARGLLGWTGNAPVARTDNWPDTWPQDWPSWRTRNVGQAIR